MDSKSIKLAINSQLENVALVCVAFEAIASFCSIDPELKGQMSICLGEAVNNAIKHAYNGKSGHQVEIDLTFTKDQVVCRIADWGHSMSEAPPPQLDYAPDNMENLPEGGMGLYIMHQFMDQVHYQTIENKNILTLSKSLGGS